MPREIVRTNQAPAAIGPYSQAVKIDRLVFVSGQLPIDPATGEMVERDIQAQTRQALKNLEAVLQAAGASLAGAVKTVVFLDNMEDFARMNAVYAEFFGADPPARACVEVARLPKDALVEIEAIAVLE
jgi:2-iminobutanoate/2-iminopropanoate deaminase